MNIPRIVECIFDILIRIVIGFRLSFFGFYYGLFLNRDPIIEIQEIVNEVLPFIKIKENDKYKIFSNISFGTQNLINDSIFKKDNDKDYIGFIVDNSELE